jgi:hypothetical protein
MILGCFCYLDWYLLVGQEHFIWFMKEKGNQIQYIRNKLIVTFINNLIVIIVRINNSLPQCPNIAQYCPPKIFRVQFIESFG